MLRRFFGRAASARAVFPVRPTLAFVSTRPVLAVRPRIETRPRPDELPISVAAAALPPLQSDVTTVGVAALAAAVAIFAAVEYFGTPNPKLDMLSDEEIGHAFFDNLRAFSLTKDVAYRNKIQETFRADWVMPHVDRWSTTFWASPSEQEMKLVIVGSRHLPAAGDRPRARLIFGTCDLGQQRLDWELKFLETSGVLRLDSAQWFEADTEENFKDLLYRWIHREKYGVVPLTDIFRHLDENGDGVITAAELEHRLKEVGLRISPEHLKQLVAEVDENHDGVISAKELQEWFGKFLLKLRYIEADKDKDGVLSWAGLLQVEQLQEFRTFWSSLHAAEMPFEQQQAFREEFFNHQGHITFSQIVVIFLPRLDPKTYSLTVSAS